MKCQPTVPLVWNPHEAPQGIYRRLFLSRRSGWQPGVALPCLTCKVTDVQVRQEHVDAYQFVTSDPGRDQTAPLFYPHALFGSAHLQMLAHPSFPLRAFGLLHLRNHVIRYRPLPTTDSWTMHCSLTRQRQVDKGLEFDFDSHVQVDGETIWTSVSTYLKRGKSQDSSEASALADLFPPLASDAKEVTTFGVPHNIGRRYAQVSGDYNPIHVSSLAAKLFGFQRAIAHGMWSVARTIHELPSMDDPIRHDVAFKGPMFVNSQASLKADENGRFDVFCGTNPRPVIVGVCRNCDADERILSTSAT